MDLCNVNTRSKIVLQKFKGNLLKQLHHQKSNDHVHFKGSKLNYLLIGLCHLLPLFDVFRAETLATEPKFDQNSK